MIIKINSVIKLRVPDNKTFEGKAAKEVSESIRQLFINKMFPPIKESTGIEITMQMSHRDLRVSP